MSGLRVLEEEGVKGEPESGMSVGNEKGKGGVKVEWKDWIGEVPVGEASSHQRTGIIIVGGTQLIWIWIIVDGLIFSSRERCVYYGAGT